MISKFTIKVSNLTSTSVGWITFLANKSLMKKMEEIFPPHKFSRSLEKYFVILWKLTIHLPSKVSVLSKANRKRKFKNNGSVNDNKCITWHWYTQGKLLGFWWFIAFILPKFCSYFWIIMFSTLQRDDKTIKSTENATVSLVGKKRKKKRKESYGSSLKKSTWTVLTLHFKCKCFLQMPQCIQNKHEITKVELYSNITIRFKFSYTNRISTFEARQWLEAYTLFLKLPHYRPPLGSQPTSHFVRLRTFHISENSVVPHASLPNRNHLAVRGTSASLKNGSKCNPAIMGTHTHFCHVNN